jgi:hypothetical protein
MLLVPTNKLFKSPLGLFFECCGITRAVPIIINETEVHLDFHIYAILEFDILIGYPLEKLFQQKPFLGSHDEKLGKTASTIPILCPKSPIVKHNPNHDSFEEAKFISLFVSPRVPSETEQSSSPSLEPKPCPSGHPNVVLSGRDSTLIVHNVSFNKENFCAMDIMFSTVCNYKHHNHISILVSKLFKMMVVDAFVYHRYCKSHSSTGTNLAA